MERIRLTTAQALVKFLNQQYVDYGGGPERFVHGVFTVFGHGNVLGLGQALQEAPGELTVYQGRNEQGMVHAATAFAKQSRRRKIMACTASVGPGAANMLTAAATATANQIPVLLLPGDTFATRQPDPVLQQMEHTYNLSITVNDAFKAVSKYWDRVTRPEQLMSAMLNAMRVLTDPGDTGAVTIALPQDVQGEAWEYPADFFRKRIHRVIARLPHPQEIAAAAGLIAGKQRPLLVCGGASGMGMPERRCVLLPRNSPFRSERPRPAKRRSQQLRVQPRRHRRHRQRLRECAGPGGRSGDWRRHPVHGLHHRLEESVQSS